MMELIIAFIVKMMDNSLSCAKTIFIAKEKYFLGSLFNALSFFFYSIALVGMVKSDSYTYIFIMCLSVFFGTYCTGILFKKNKRDKLYIYEITATSVEKGKSFADVIRNGNISAVKTSFAYNDKLEQVLVINVYCSTREESSIIEDIIPSEFKYYKYAPIE